MNFRAEDRIEAQHVSCLVNPGLEKLQCVISQESAFVACDGVLETGPPPENDTHNSCTFIAILLADRVVVQEGVSFQQLREMVHDVILNFPVVVNEVRNRDRMYAVDTALDILQKCHVVRSSYQLLNHIPAGAPVPYPTACEQLQQGLGGLISGSDVKVAIYTCPPYTFLFVYCCGAIYLVDTHPVPSKFGGNGTALVLMAEGSEAGSSSLGQWLFCRMGVQKKSFQHDMVILQPGTCTCMYIF